VRLEGPITIEMGTNTLLGLDPGRTRDVPRLARVVPAERAIPPKWDGNAAVRIVDAAVARAPPARAGSVG
jgi:hypothetical protein